MQLHYACSLILYLKTLFSRYVFEWDNLTAQLATVKHDFLTADFVNDLFAHRLVINHLTRQEDKLVHLEGQRLLNPVSAEGHKKDDVHKTD